MIIRGKYIEGGLDLTICPILHERPANYDWLFQVSAF